MRFAAAVALAIAALYGAHVSADEADAQTQRPRVVLPKDSPFSLRLPEQQQVVFKGVVSLDAATSHAQVPLYVAPGLVGLLAEVATHGVIANSTNKSDKERLEADADKVLSRYRDALAGYTHTELFRRALKMANGLRGSVLDPGATNPDLIVDTTPVFYMTQDQKALVLENEVTVHSSARGDESLYHNNIKVVSRATQATNQAEFWSANQAENLKQESARAFAESLEIAFGDASASLNTKDAVFKTIRYSEGNEEKLERAQVLAKTCDRLLIRTLRDSLMSVPAGTSEVAPSCSADGAARK